MTGKKLVNRHCTTRRTVLGDKYLLISLQTKVGKDNHVAAFDLSKKKDDKKKFKGKLNQFSAAIINKPSTDKAVPVETIKRVDLTGIPDDELYGSAFLYEETEFCTEKKIISTNPVRMNLESSYSSESDNEFDTYDQGDH